MVGTVTGGRTGADTADAVKSCGDTEMATWIEEGRRAKATLAGTPSTQTANPDGTKTWEVQTGASTAHTGSGGACRRARAWCCAYALKAVRAAVTGRERESADRLECRWQREQLPDVIRKLVREDQRLRNETCWSVFDCRRA